MYLPYYPPPLALPPGHVRCPFCGWQGAPLVHQRIASRGWVWFAVLLVFCLPLAWIPLVTVKERRARCVGCGMVLGGM